MRMGESRFVTYTSCGKSWTMVVKFSPHLFYSQVKIDLKEHLRALPEVDAEHFEVLYETAKHSIIDGEDASSLANRIVALAIDQIASERARQIALTLWRRARGRLERMHQERLSVTEAIWRYAAPCLPTLHKPSAIDRKVDLAHQAADGTLYRIHHGLHINRQPTWPGEGLDCKCWDQILLPRGSRWIRRGYADLTCVELP